MIKQFMVRVNKRIYFATKGSFGDTICQLSYNPDEDRISKNEVFKFSSAKVILLGKEKDWVDGVTSLIIVDSQRNISCVISQDEKKFNTTIDGEKIPTELADRLKDSWNIAHLSSKSISLGDQVFSTQAHYNYRIDVPSHLFDPITDNDLECIV